MKRHMGIGLSMRGIGTHAAGWRQPRAQADGHVDIHFYVKMAQMAERAKLDMIFFADRQAISGRGDESFESLSRLDTCVHLEPIGILNALAMVTSHIGLVSTASTTYYTPYIVARKFASLDLISGGRGGWNLVTSWAPSEALNFSRTTPLEYDERYERGTEFAQVVKGLWDSWDDDAFVRDQQTGQFFDPEKVRAIEHIGKHFQVKGPGNVPRSPQGRPVIIQAGGSAQGQEIAAAYADAVFAASQTIEEARTYYDSVKGRMAKYGRHPDELKIMPGLTVIVGETEEHAREQYEILQEQNEVEGGLGQISTIMGDVSAFPLDGPVPDPPAPKLRSRAIQMVDMARKNNWTIRQLAKWIAAAHGHRMIMGTARTCADQMQEWFEAGVLDGYNIMPSYMPGPIEDFCTQVVPELQRRGLFRTEYEGNTLRDNLGLVRPANPYFSSEELAQTA